MNFQMNPQSLGAMNSVPIDMTLQALDWQQKAQQADQMSLAEMAAQQQRAAQEHVLRQETGRLNNETTLAQLPGVRAQSERTQRSNRIEETTFEPELKQKLTDFAIKATDSDLRAYEQQVQKLLNSPPGSPERKQGEKLWQASGVMMKAREDHKLKMEIEGAQTYRTLEAARIAAKSRETVATSKGSPEGAASNIINSINNGKLNYERGATAFFTLAELMEDSDPRKAQYMGIASKLEAAALNKANAGAKPSPDLEAMGIKTSTPQPVPALGVKPKLGTPENPIKLD